MLKESLRMSWQNIRANKMRSFLTILGIVIGVTAIIALITTVESATHEMTRQFSELGAGKVSISVSGTALKNGLTEADLERLSALENIESLDPTVSFTRHVSNGQRMAEDITIEGRNAVYFQLHGRFDQCRARINAHGHGPQQPRLRDRCHAPRRALSRGKSPGANVVGGRPAVYHRRLAQR